MVDFFCFLSHQKVLEIPSTNLIKFPKSVEISCFPYNENILWINYIKDVKNIYFA